MKLVLKQVLQSVSLGMVIPGMLLSATARFTNTRTAEPEPEVTQVWEDQSGEELLADEEPLLIPVLLSNGETVQMELEEYISRVVLGEVPASFELEALKAQAIAARTYTLRCYEQGNRHEEGGVCTDYHCCQAYRDPEEYLLSGGTEDNLAKIYYAVAQTKGQVLRYEGQLICATYFANSGGSTEDAEEVWGQAYPYLTVVSSPEPEDSAYYSETVRFTAEEFQKMLGVTLTGSPDSWIGNISYTVGGGVDKIRIGAKLYSGVEVRSLFDLRSTIFTVTAAEDSVVFETKGYGHRVGMSQYGADAMAVSGSSCEEILAHYYPGTSLVQYD